MEGAKYLSPKVHQSISKHNKELILGGWVVIGHEVRSFEPCDGKQALWVMGDGSALREIIAAYNKALRGANPYKKLFMILGGELTGAPEVGFGAEYKAGFKLTRIVSVSPERSCKRVLQQLTELTYIQKIDECFFE